MQHDVSGIFWSIKIMSSFVECDQMTRNVLYTTILIPQCVTLSFICLGYAKIYLYAFCSLC